MRKAKRYSINLTNEDLELLVDALGDYIYGKGQVQDLRVEGECELYDRLAELLRGPSDKSRGMYVFSCGLLEGENEKKNQ